MKRILVITMLGCFMVVSAWGQLYSPGGNLLDSENDFVGIRVASPKAQLVVGSTFGASISGATCGKGVFGSNLAVYQGGDNHCQLYTPYNHTSYGYSGMVSSWGNLTFYTASGTTIAGEVVTPSSRIFVRGSDGYIGVGTNSPLSKLSIQSGNRATAYYNGLAIYSYNDGSKIRSSLSATSDDNGRLNLYNSSTSLKVQINADGNSYFNSGNVGIGTTSPDAKLEVNGDIRAERIDVVSDITSDFVFEDDYNLRTLEEVESFVKENKHLPEIPSAKDLEGQTYSVGEMDDLLLRKVEELTLYVIELKKEIEKLKNQKTELQ
jgi:hypothetical protein